MGYTRGKFGVEYHPVETETHRLRGLVFVVLVLVAVAFVWYKISSHKPSVDTPVEDTVNPPTAIGATGPTISAVTNAPVLLPPPKPTPTVAPEVRPLVKQLLDTESSRPQQEQVLIRRYAEAERQENLRNSMDAIKKLYNRPSMADLRDPLMRRLGDLNRQMLFSGNLTPWTRRITVRRGDSRDRIARENRTTPAAVAKLNPLVKWEKLRPGDTVTVFKFLSPILVVHKQLGYADLSLLNGEFFRRYYLTTSKSAKCEVYPISPEAGQGVSARFRQLGIRLAPTDRAELEMFLSSGARITVTEQ